MKIKYNPPLRRFARFLSMDEDEGFVETSRDEFDDYCALVARYLSLLGLTDWHVDFVWADNNGEESACLSYDYKARTATFFFGKTAKSYFRNRAFLATLAAHEVLHLLFAGFDYALEQRLPRNELEVIEHGIVRRLERIVAASTLDECAYLFTDEEAEKQAS